MSAEDELDEYIKANLDDAIEEWMKTFICTHIIGEGTGEPLGILGTINEEES